MIIAVVVLLGASGLPTVAVAAMRVDTCADDCGDEGEPERPAERGQGCPTDGPAGCPPFCHTCACFSPYARPEVITQPAEVLPSAGAVAFEDALPIPPSPPLRGVFHPPRRTA
jgi:hypothetical protein